jgi:broad specificity phosphatase PhoE
MIVGKHVRLAIVAVIASVALPCAAQAQQLIYVVRHAERADGGAGAGAMQSQTDPLLSKAGEARAAKLATMLADAGVTAIYATEYRRTQDTARPLAARLGLKVASNPAREGDALVAKLKKDHAAEVVLVVGHSNSIPALIKAYGGQDITIRDDEYDCVFVVVPATRTVSRIRY